MDNRSDDQLLAIIWNYLAIESAPKHADVIIADGTKDVNVAHLATELYSMSFAPTIIMSGGEQPNSDMTIADAMTKIARAYDVPESAIIKDVSAKNTTQVITNAQALLYERGITPKTVILVDAPYMSRTLLATAQAQWKGELPEFISRHESTSLPEYSLRHGRGETIRDILGNFQRLRSYAKKGFQSEQIIPENVQIAYDALIWRGHKSR
ncbi:MAG TPA: ElyC/SanA/YdcF family protein [Candidatus Saccharimonadales bacterium]|jgi:uncharacterized SAM-binding protein YcdF (DUF218 family)|nr:ElyC/SanA/YdcF family protein [Candidatus Saccharimonadales bacterium]